MEDTFFRETTKGEFLHEKLSNMARWVTQEVGKENLPVDILAGIAGRSALEVTMLCGTIQANRDLATHRNWSGLVQLLDGQARELQAVVIAIQRRPDLHDKFWRYIELFITVSEQ